MKILILTGMLASGKSIALRYLQDLGYYCTDNIPPPLMEPFIALALDNPAISRIALVADMRSGSYFEGMPEAIEHLKESYGCEVLFFDADDEILIQRYKAQRRRHLLARGERIEETIMRERIALGGIRDLADHVVDTSQTSEAQLKENLTGMFDRVGDGLRMRINVVSFGFKYGILKDADLVIDVRFLPNPFYDPVLKGLCGLDKEVIDFMMRREETGEFVRRYSDLLDYLLPRYKKEGKTQLIIGVGCTGGRHRSVVVSGLLASHLETEGAVSVSHRDVGKDQHA